MASKSQEIKVKLRTPHPKQKLFMDSDKHYCLVRAGRRSGKTTGVATLAVRSFVQGKEVLYAGPTQPQADRFWREVNMALAAPIAAKKVKKNQHMHTLTHPLGNVLTAKTAFNADTLRGGFADLLILDEWQMMNEDTWEEVGHPMLMDNGGRVVFCYTPPSLKKRASAANKADDKMHAMKMFRREKNNPDWLCMSFTSNDNPHLNQKFVGKLRKNMNDLTYRMEILAEDIEEAPGALWKRAMFNREQRKPAPVDMERVVVAIDPSGTKTGDNVGIVAAGLSGGMGWILGDYSVSGMSPRGWAGKAIEVYHALQADHIVAEVNYGGAMVEGTLRAIDPDIPYVEVHASRGKDIRAEPVATLYERKKVMHTQPFPELEDECCMWMPGMDWSPGRMDAMVWAITDLMLEETSRFVVLTDENEWYSLD